MKFKHENTRLQIKYSCKLKCNRCTAQNRAGRRCKNTVCIGTDVCHVHRKSLGLRVGGSLIPNAGKGLFATKVFRKNEVIGFYAGKAITTQQKNERYGADSTVPYMIDGTTGMHIDSACLRSLMSIANGSPFKTRSNAKFSTRPMGDGTVKVTATDRLNVGDEIIIFYGPLYFQGMPYSVHSTTR